MAISGPFGLFKHGLAAPGLSPGFRPGLAPRDLSRGDYTRDETGALRTGTVTQQRVLIALTTPLGSMPSAPEVGSTVPLLDRDDGHLELTVLRDTERALRQLLADGSISLDSVEVSVEDGTLVRTITWTDLRTGQRFPTTL